MRPPGPARGRAAPRTQLRLVAGEAGLAHRLHQQLRLRRAVRVVARGALAPPSRDRAAPSLPPRRPSASRGSRSRARSAPSRRSFAFALPCGWWQAVHFPSAAGSCLDLPVELLLEVVAVAAERAAAPRPGARGLGGVRASGRSCSRPRPRASPGWRAASSRFSARGSRSTARAAVFAVANGFSDVGGAWHPAQSLATGWTLFRSSPPSSPPSAAPWHHRSRSLRRGSRRAPSPARASRRRGSARTARCLRAVRRCRVGARVGLVAGAAAARRGLVDDLLLERLRRVAREARGASRPASGGARTRDACGSWHFVHLPPSRARAWTCACSSRLAAAAWQARQSFCSSVLEDERADDAVPLVARLAALLVRERCVDDAARGLLARLRVAGHAGLLRPGDDRTAGGAPGREQQGGGAGEERERSEGRLHARGPRGHIDPGQHTHADHPGLH